MMEKSRIIYYDYAKAVAMLCVLLFHFFSVDMIGGTLTIMLYTLHVPTFFYVSGVFLQSSLKKYDTKQIVYSRFIGLFLPFILWTVLLSIWKYGVDLFWGKTESIHMIIMSSIHELWFFPCLYIAIVYIAISKKFVIPEWISGGIAFVAFIAFAWYNQSIAKLAISIVIVWLGYIHRDFTKGKSIVIIGGYFILLLILRFGLHLDVDAEGILGFPLLEIEGIKLLGCMVIPAAMWAISLFGNSVDKGKSIAASVGRHTKSIYILHFIPLTIYRKAGIVNVNQAIVGVGVSLCVVFLLYRGCHFNKRIERALFLNE